MGSRGSVLPLFLEQKKHGEVTITDERMTRFMITLEQGVELVLTALADASFGNIYVKKIPSMNIVDIAETVAPGASKKIIGIRAGEKLHEQMIGAEDANFTYDCGQHYVIVPGNLIGTIRHYMRLTSKKFQSSLHTRLTTIPNGQPGTLQKFLRITYG